MPTVAVIMLVCLGLTAYFLLVRRTQERRKPTVKVARCLLHARRRAARPRS